ncbi:MAG: DUF1848 domain-containing protein [Bacteroidales bacterium]|nr:MAG: DUF1848 domain-containing protein [Bacteroidales bacterium]
MIISASRRTDIPSLYGEWFINRINKGFLFVRNPFNPAVVYKIDLNPDIVDCIVFWTKNPNPFINKLQYLSQYRYYFHFTVTPYGNTLEKNLPDKKDIINTFRILSGRIGKERVVWRYDPIIYTDKINMDYHLMNFEYLIKELHRHTGKCIISFIHMYNKCRRNLEGKGARELTDAEIPVISEKMARIANNYNIKIETCASKTDLSDHGINPGSCIDKQLIEKIISRNLNISKDKNQRKQCNCFESIDIGEYNTCVNNCLYCYANFNFETARQNFKRHDPESPFLTGSSTDKDTIQDRTQKSLIANDIKMFS